MVHIKRYYGFLWDGRKIRNFVIARGWTWWRTGICVRYLRKTLATSWGVKISSFQLRSFPYCHFRRVGSQREDSSIMVERQPLTRGGDSNFAWRSRIRLLLPFIRKVPSISVAVFFFCHLRNKGNHPRGGRGNKEGNQRRFACVHGREGGRTHLSLSNRDRWDYVGGRALAEIMANVRVKNTHDFATTTGM